MSYGINTQCSFCTKKEVCKDKEKIEKALSEIHSTSYEQGHQGGGSIIIHCNRQDTTVK